jgi:tRNA-intron endonuclease
LSNHQYSCELIENKLVVWNLDEARALFSRGFYGKPIGIPKPKSSDFNAPVILDLLEGYYLMSKGQLGIRRHARKIGEQELLDICKEEYVQFEEKLLVYTKLRESGFVVTPGIKFGADFAAYERGPGLDHAPYLVRVTAPTLKVSATDIVLAGRLATTVRKQFIMAVPNLAENRVSFIGFDWWRA